MSKPKVTIWDKGDSKCKVCKHENYCLIALICIPYDYRFLNHDNRISSCPEMILQ